SFALFLEAGLDDARTAAADAAGVGQGEVKGVARCILVNGNQARHAATLLVFAAHGVAGALRRDHDDVNTRLRLDKAEMHVEAVCKGNRCAVADVGGNLVPVDIGLQLVRCGHHDQVRPAGEFGDGLDLQAVGLDLPGGRGTGLEPDGNLLDARILQVERMRPALRTIADNTDLLALDEIEIGVAIIIDTHVTSFRV